MRKNIIYILSVLIGLIVPLTAAENLKYVEQWRHNGQIFSGLYDGQVNSDGELILLYGKCQFALVSKDKFVNFAFRGEAPSELIRCLNYFSYGKDFTFVEQPEKAKIFTKKNGTYVWKDTKWFKRGIGSHTPLQGVFFDNKFFFSGFHINSRGDNQSFNAFLLRVYDNNGNLVKDLIERKYPKATRMNQVYYFLAPYKSDRLFFVPANELKVYVIAVHTLGIPKEVSLQSPSFYKKMPSGFYLRESYADHKYDLGRDLETWASEYSRITRVRIDKNHIVLQLQTCSNQLKKYALLFYNAETFKLENTIYTDDLLLDIKNGKYYFFAKGEPGLDENVGDDCVINVYKLDSK